MNEQMRDYIIKTSIKLAVYAIELSIERPGVEEPQVGMSMVSRINEEISAYGYDIDRWDEVPLAMVLRSLDLFSTISESGTMSILTKKLKMMNDEGKR